MRVQLRCAPLPYLGRFAVHCWLVTLADGGECHRWEVWQSADAGGRSFGHLHCDLKPPEDGVGGGPSRVAAEWHGEQALALKKILEAPASYPFCGKYRYWPGPNSNTYAAWVLRQAGIRYAFPWNAFGARYTTGARG